MGARDAGGDAQDVVVLGGGLAGLVAADALHAAGRTVTVVEARPFVGGRTMTLRPADPDIGEDAWFDVGATWHWEDQPRIRALASELGLATFPERRDGQVVVEAAAGEPPQRVALPPPSPREFRFVGGAQQLCERLAARLPAGSVLLDTIGSSVEEAGGGGLTVSVAGADGSSRDLPAAAVVVALPPRLVLQDLAFTPDLPAEVESALRRTPTWMATALKCVAVYETAFWRDEGLAGAVSDVGPLREVHDASNHDGTVAALWGFVSPRHEWRDLSFDDRIKAVFTQLGRLFGERAADPLRYFERDWSGDPYTNDEVFAYGEDLLAYGDPAFHQPLMGGRLVWAGAETVAPAEGGGHLEGAVASGQRAATQVEAALA